MRVLDLELEVMRGLGSIPTGATFFTGIFCFHVIKPLMPILASSPTLFNFEKTGFVAECVILANKCLHVLGKGATLLKAVGY